MAHVGCCLHFRGIFMQCLQRVVYQNGRSKSWILRSAGRVNAEALALEWRVPPPRELSCSPGWPPSYCTVLMQAVRTCPVCRRTTHFVTPSMTWPASAEDKAAVVDAYKSKLAQIDCRHFAQGEGRCPFGTSCMYRHAYRNGQLEVMPGPPCPLIAPSKGSCTAASEPSAWLLSMLDHTKTFPSPRNRTMTVMPCYWYQYELTVGCVSDWGRVQTRNEMKDVMLGTSGS